MTFTEIYNRHRITKIDGQISYKLWHITSKHLKRHITIQADREISDQIYFCFLMRTGEDDDE